MFSKLLEFITRKPRYMPEIIWSDKSWTHNVFRTYEKLFGRKVGIRPEMRSSGYLDEDGQLIVEYELYSFESVIAFAETKVREWLNPGFVLKRVENLQFAPDGFQTFQPTNPYIKFAIALDVASNYGTSSGSGTSPYTWSHTTTGSNLIMAVGAGATSNNNTQNNTTAVSYNSVAATKAQADTNTTNFASESSVWLLGGPSTGANTVSVSFSGGFSPKGYAGAVTYTGTSASSTKDASNGSNGTGTGDKTVSVTTVADNCWIFATMTAAGNTGTVTADQTSRFSSSVVGFHHIAGEDTNAAQTPAGGHSVGFTIGVANTNWCLSAVSFAPAGGSNLSVTVSDTATTSESVVMRLNSFVNTSDTATTSESNTQLLISNVNVNDTATTSESVKLLLESNVNVSDTVTTSESQTLLIPTLFVSVSDNATLSESVTPLETSFVNVSDTATLTESVGIAFANLVSVSDTATLSESIALQLLSFVTVSDNLTLTENQSLLIPTLFITTSDTATTSEAILLQDQEGIAVLDSVALSENVQLSGVPNPNVNDTLILSENIQLLLTSNVNKSDTVTFTEALSEFVTPRFVTVSDNLTLSESVGVFMTQLFVSVSDNITLTEILQINGNTPPPIPYRLLNPAHRHLGPRTLGRTRPRLGPRPTRGPR